MALKQNAALAALQKAGELIETSLCEVQGAWLALVKTAAGKRLAYAAQGETVLGKLWKEVETSTDADGVHVDVMKLNANNAAALRRYVKWTAPSACGTKGASVGFSDWLGEADAAVVPLFSKRQLKPVLVDFTAEDSAALGRTFIAAVDTATWGVLEAGYKDGFGANAAGLKSNDDIVKALLYGYSMIGLDCSDKIDLGIEKLSDEAVDKRFEQFPDAFRAAMHASYLNAEFKVGANKITFTENQLHRIVLEYGEAIMHIQSIYIDYLKNTPWDIDFELSLSKPGKVLTPQEHYLIANELQRNGIKMTAICLDPLKDAEALAQNLEVHCEIADTFGYRLSFENADIAMPDTAAAMKYLKGKVHFKMNNILWMSAVKLVKALDAELFAKLCAACGCEVPAGAVCGRMENGRALALGYKKALNPQEEGNVASEMKAFLEANHDAYIAEIQKNVGAHMKNI